MLTVQSHDRKNSEDSAELLIKQVKIWVNFNENSLNFCSAMKQDYINWDSAVKAEIKSLKKNEIFEITFLSSEKTAINSRWVFKHKEKTVSIVKQTADRDYADDHDNENVDNLLSSSWTIWHQQEQELMKIKIHYKTCLIVRDFKQQYEIDYWVTFSFISHMITVRMLLILAVYYQ